MENLFEDGDGFYKDTAKLWGLESRRVGQEHSMVVSANEGVVVDVVTWYVMEWKSIRHVTRCSARGGGRGGRSASGRMQEVLDDVRKDGVWRWWTDSGKGGIIRVNTQVCQSNRLWKGWMSSLMEWDLGRKKGQSWQREAASHWRGGVERGRPRARDHGELVWRLGWVLRRRQRIWRLQSRRVGQEQHVVVSASKDVVVDVVMWCVME